MRHSEYDLPVRTVVIYAIFASLWILLSDRSLLIFATTSAQLVLWETAKGWLFVAVSSLLLFFVLRRYTRSRRAVERDRHLLASAIEQVAEVIVVTDSDGRIQYVNPAFEAVTGYGRDEVIGGNPRILKSGKHDAEFYRNLWETITRGETWRGRLVNKRKDGTLFTEEASISPVMTERGEIVAFVAAKRDISNELELEAQLVQSQKLESLGTLAAGIAHDFNNILAVILGYSTATEEPTRADTRGRLEAIRQAAFRGAALVRQLLTFARKSEATFAELGLNDLVAEIDCIVRETFPKNIDVKVKTSVDLPKVRADHAQLHQVLLNLCINSRDAMPDGGELSIRTWSVPGASLRNPASTESEYVAVALSDTGQGMTESTLERVFEPFFTTKNAGKGTGLGLSVVYGIVRNHGGFIELHSEVGKGTTVTVYLPSVHMDQP